MVKDKMDKICLNCKWWGRDYKSVCDKINHINAKAEIIVNVADDTDLNVKLKTDSTFGCNQWEEDKEEEEEETNE